MVNWNVEIVFVIVIILVGFVIVYGKFVYFLISGFWILSVVLIVLISYVFFYD